MFYLNHEQYVIHGAITNGYITFTSTNNLMFAVNSVQKESTPRILSKKLFKLGFILMRDRGIIVYP